MKTLVFSLITFYQKYISFPLHQFLGIRSACRRYPSCSEYAKEAVAQYGIEKGLLLSVRRILSCQPFFNV